MQKLKKYLKLILPISFLNLFLPLFHLLQSFSASARYGFPARGMRVVGVTGTNGKTTTAVMIAKILEQAGFSVGLSSSAMFQTGKNSWENDLNMTVSSPFELQKLLRRMKKEKVDWVVVEVTSHALSQHRILGIPIHSAVLTNLTPDHLDYHKTVHNYATAKSRLFAKAKQNSVLNSDDGWFNFFRKKVKSKNIITYGIANQSNYVLKKATLGDKYTKFEVDDGETVDVYQISLPGKFNVYNALAAVSITKTLGVAKDIINDALIELRVPGRFERIDEGQAYSVVVDYAHEAEAFKKLFESIKPLIKGKLIVVFGGMPMHDYIEMGRVAGEWVDIAIVTDDEPMDQDPNEIRAKILESIHEKEKTETIEIADRKQAIKKAFTKAKSEDFVAILCLGSQKYRRVKDGRIAWDDRDVARDVLAHLPSSDVESKQ
jgi:UDP-N-acetylmuramoyl-L-alanyl-D-glutamate--2,6-diaminopimelate ligase